MKQFSLRDEASCRFCRHIRSLADTGTKLSVKVCYYCPRMEVELPVSSKKSEAESRDEKNEVELHGGEKNEAESHDNENEADALDEDTRLKIDTSSLRFEKLYSEMRWWRERGVTNRHIVKQEMTVTSIKRIVNAFTSIVSERAVLVYEKKLLDHLSSMHPLFDLLLDLNIGHSVYKHEFNLTFQLVMPCGGLSRVEQRDPDRLQPRCDAREQHAHFSRGPASLLLPSLQIVLSLRHQHLRERHASP